jgi:hypothetical protein
MAETGWPLIPREVLPAPVPPATRGRRPQRAAQSAAGRQLSIFGAETTEPSPFDLAGLLAGPGRLDRMGGTARVAVTVDSAWRVHVLVAELVSRGLVVHWRPLQEPGQPHDEVRRVPSPQEPGAHPHTGGSRVNPVATSRSGATARRPHRPDHPNGSTDAPGAGRASAFRAEPGSADPGGSPPTSEGIDPRGLRPGPDGIDPADLTVDLPADLDGFDVADFAGDPALDDVGVIGADPAPRAGAAGERGGDDARADTVTGAAGGDAIPADEPPTGRVLFEVRTAYSSRLNGVARAWPAAADQLFLSGPRLRLWVAAAGRPLDGGYALGLGGHDGATWPAVDAALRRTGLDGALSDHGLDYLITGRKRLARLAELVGDPPEAAPAALWPGGAAA